MNPMLRLATSALLATSLLSGCAGGGTSGGENPLVEALYHVKDHPEDRDFAAAWCEASLGQRRDDFPIGAFFAGMLDVPEAAGGQAFCAALVEAVIGGDLQDEDIAVFSQAQEVRSHAAAGTLLRALLVAHERLKTQEVLDQAPAATESLRPS